MSQDQCEPRGHGGDEWGIPSYCAANQRPEGDAEHDIERGALAHEALAPDLDHHRSENEDHHGAQRHLPGGKVLSLKAQAQSLVKARGEWIK